MEKTMYERTELEIIEFKSSDVITTTSDLEYQGEIVG